MVWMRSSAFPSFRKLYGRVLLEENVELGHMIEIPNLKSKFSKNYTNQTTFHLITKFRLPKGNYFVEIAYSNFNLIINFFFKF